MTGKADVQGLLPAALEAHPDCVELLDLEDKYLFVNRAFCDLTGLSTGEILGESAVELLQAGGDTGFDYGLGEAKKGRVWRGRVVRQLLDGDKTLAQDATMLPVRRDGAIAAVLVISRESSAVINMNELLGRTDRMAAVGRLAAGVGHEINNPLSYILGNVTFLREEISRQQDKLDSAIYTEIVASLEDVHHGAMRVRDIVQELGSFAKIGEQGAVQVDVVRIIESILQLLHNELNHRALVVRNFQKVPLIWCNGARLGQVLLNLLLNAVDAIPVGAAQQNTVELVVRPGPEGHIEIQIRDSGVGIESDVLPHVFDPFFTTKPVGAGSGLGLSTSHAIVADMKGQLTIHSEVRSGTTVTLMLPVTQAPEHREIPRVKRVTAAGTRGQILVIDDQGAVLRTVTRILDAHNVATCESGADALELLGKQPFDIVFCDLMMPDLTGEELYERVRSLDPAMAERFVFITGGAFTDAAERFLRKIENQIVEKPFDPIRLRQLVDRLLA